MQTINPILPASTNFAKVSKNICKQYQKDIDKLNNNSFVIHEKYPYLCDMMITILICLLLSFLPLNGEARNMAVYYQENAISSIIANISTGQNTQSRLYNGKELDMMHGLRWHDHGARFADNTILRWTTMDPLCEKFYDTSPYVFCGNNPLKYQDSDGNSPFSVLLKYAAKKGVQAGVNTYVKRNIQHRLQNYMSKNMLKQFVKDADDIIDMLENSWWETAIEFIPVAGDIYGSTKFVNKLRKVYDKLQDLENKYVDNIQKSLSGKQRKQFIKRMRRRGIDDARKDQSKGLENIGGDLKYEKNKDIVGHHKESVSLHPEKMTDPRNVEFMYNTDHVKYHQRYGVE